MKITGITAILIVLAALSVPFQSAAAVEDPPAGEWVLKSIRRVENNPLLTHFLFEVYRPPFGKLDKIALHRVVRTLGDNNHENEDENEEGNNGWKTPVSDPDKVIVMISGTWEAGRWSEITDPAINPMIFLAVNGYDVYNIDFRTLNIPCLDYEQFETYNIDISCTADWNYGVFREDIKACVEKIKQLTGAKKIFMSGFSRGGVLMFIYASKYQADLKGLVSLDGGIKKYPPSGTKWDESTYNQVVKLFKDGLLVNTYNREIEPWLVGIEGVSDQTYPSWKLAGVLPYARNLVGETLPEKYDVISDYVADKAHYLMGDGIFTNYHGGNIQRDVLVTVLNEFARYLPLIQGLEDAQMAAYEDVPFLDYDDNDIYLPAIAFLTPLMCPGKICLQEYIHNSTKHPDVTIIYMEKYGHMDVLYGTHSLEDVKKPLLEWLNNH